VKVWYVNVFVSDLARSVAFFERKLGLSIVHGDPSHGYVGLSAGSIGIGLAEVSPDAPESAALLGRHTGIGFGVEDLVAEHARLEAAGVPFTMPPERQPWGGFMALFHDPDGNVFYLDQLRAG
jgi:catechol 2,3-dioxygenase-like lactoylglutathione lyase family enzyme